MERLLLRIVEAAEIAGVSRTKMYELVGSGAVESVAIGRSRRIPVESLRKFVDELKSGHNQR
jgi:excisionase family DNA binding protein